jgi:hypothetical protein
MVLVTTLPLSSTRSCPSEDSPRFAYYQAIVPGSPLNGPTTSLVIQPP